MVTAALVGLLVAANASAVTATGFVGLYVSVTGSGTLSVTGVASFTCPVRRRPCTHRFDVPRGSRVVVRAMPRRGWKLAGWAGACQGSSATCSLQLEARRRVKVTFVPPGDYLNPYRLGRAVKLNAWRLKVDSATLDADARVEAVIDPTTGKPANPPPPLGTQYALVAMTLAYLRPGSSRRPLEGYVREKLLTEEPVGGAVRLYPADRDCEAPPVDLGAVSSQVASGESVTGYACYEIRSAEADKLVLTPRVFVRKNGPYYRQVVFALTASSGR